MNPKAAIGDHVNFLFGIDYNFVSCGYDKYEILNSRYIEESDRYENDYYDDSIVHYIHAGFIKCSDIVIKSLDPFCVELDCSNNIENIESVPNRIKRAIKTTYIQTLIAYKKFISLKRNKRMVIPHLRVFMLPMLINAIALLLIYSKY